MFRLIATVCGYAVGLRRHHLRVMWGLDNRGHCGCRLGPHTSCANIPNAVDDTDGWLKAEQEAYQDVWLVVVETETETWPRIEYAFLRALVAAHAGITLRSLPPANLAVET